MKNLLNKNKIVLLTLLIGCITVQRAQGQNDSCQRAQFFCENFTDSFCFEDGSPHTFWYYFHVGDTIASIDITTPNSFSGYTVWGPIDTLASSACDVSGSEGSPVLGTEGGASSYTINNGSYIPPGYYYLELTSKYSCSSFTVTVEGGSLECPLPCENCIGSFAPEAGKKYLVSAWAKESGAPPTKTSYNKPGLYVSFTGSATTYGPFHPSGQIIDGWQRVEEEFTVPLGATSIKMQLQCDSGDCYFDDIRVYPFDGSFKTYVYDPITLRLVAELDERNYATMYEYDEEGKLLRVKKETERGVMTIQESKTSINKR